MHSAPASRPSLTLGHLVADLLGVPEGERDLSIADLGLPTEADPAAADQGGGP